MATLDSLISGYKSTVQSLDPPKASEPSPQSQESDIDRRLRRIKQLQSSTHSLSKRPSAEEQQRNVVEEENQSLRREIDQIQKHNNKQCDILLDEKNEILNELLITRAESDKLRDTVQNYQHQILAIQESGITSSTKMDGTSLGLRAHRILHHIPKAKGYDVYKEHQDKITMIQQQMKTLSNDLLANHQSAHDQLQHLLNSSQFHLNLLMRELKLNQEIIQKQSVTIQQLLDDKSQIFKQLISQKQNVQSLRGELDDAKFKISKLERS